MTFVNPHWSFGSVNTDGALTSPLESNTDEANKSALDRFAAIIQKGLGKLGLIVQDGIARAKEFIADKITTKNLCVEDICVDKEQFKELLNRNQIQSAPTTPLPTPELEVVPELIPEVIPQPESAPEPILELVPEIVPESTSEIVPEPTPE
jgi:hypothetical protein